MPGNEKYETCATGEIVCYTLFFPTVEYFYMYSAINLHIICSYAIKEIYDYV